MTDKPQYTRDVTLDNKSLLSSIQDIFDKEIYFHLSVFFDSLKGILFVFEQNSKTDYKQSLNYTALQFLIRQRKIVSKNIVSSVNTAFKYFQQTDYDFFINENLKISNYQKIKLRSNQEDEMAIVMQLINKSEDANDKALHLLSNLFSEMTASKNLTFNQIPVSPFVVVNSLVNSIKELDLNSGIRMIVYNTFEVNVILKLNRIYQKLIDKLSHQLMNMNDPKNNQILKKILDAKYTIIKQIFERHHKQKKQDLNQKKYISKGLIIQTLNVIQEKKQKAKNLVDSYTHNSKELKSLLNKSIKKSYQNAKNLSYSHSDSDTIHLVMMLFQYISNDKSIDINLKRLLLRLEIPILKIALQETEFFKYTTNPIRLLLNQMSYVPVGFNDNLDSSNKYFIKLKEIVAVMLIQTAYNGSLYQNLLTELNEFTEMMKKKFNLIQRRIKEKAVGLEKISTIKTLVLSLLEELMHDRYMPTYIRNLLLETWNNVLVIAFLRHPEESHNCQSKIEFVEILLDYSKPFKDKIVNLNDVNKIALQFSEGLDLVAFNSKDLVDKKNELLSFLFQVHGLEQELDKIENIILGRQHSDVMLYLKDDVNISNVINDKVQVSDQYVDKVKALKVGNWLEFTNDKSKCYRAKISWISPITGMYLLVNSNGVRLADKTPIEIADNFRNNTCHKLKIIPLIDRALLYIAKEMNEKLKP